MSELLPVGVSKIQGVPLDPKCWDSCIWPKETTDRYVYIYMYVYIYI